MDVIYRQTNARGLPVGESNRLCRHSDETVAQAIALRETGASTEAIARALGVPQPTVWRWVNGKTRRPAVRVVAVAVSTPPVTDLSLKGAKASRGAARSAPGVPPTPGPTPDGPKPQENPGAEFA